jgi:antirestriction protein
MNTQNKTLDTKIYVGTYAKYNDGSIGGDWFDLCDYSDAEDLLNAIAEFHDDETDAEFMIQDSEGFMSKGISESLCESELQAIYDTFESIESSHLDVDIIEAYCECYGYDIEDVKISDIEESYVGSYDSDSDFAEELANELGYMDKDNHWPYNCIDWDYAARELMYDYSEHNGHYFRSN